MCPIVEYNSIIWSPSTASDIDAVESVQRCFTKILPILYRERLKCLNIFSLELRRLHTDLFWCYKIVFGLLISWSPSTAGLVNYIHTYITICRARCVDSTEYMSNQRRCLMTCLFLAPASTLVGINLNSTSAKPIAVYTCQFL